jgi:hypothetical protein
LLGGHTDLQMLPAGSAVGLMRGGKVKVIAVSTSGRFFDSITRIPANRFLQTLLERKIVYRLCRNPAASHDRYP